MHTLFDQSEHDYSVRTGCTSQGVRTLFDQSEHDYSVRTGCTSLSVRTLFDQSEHDILMRVRPLNMCVPPQKKRLVDPYNTADKIHSSHLEMEKCLNHARDCLFWPGNTKQIQKKVEKCHICNRYRNKQVKEPLMQHEVPGRPWQTLAVDLFVFGTDKYLVLVDYYSKYFELNQLSDGTSNTIVNVLKQRFARHGIPELLYSDIGPGFASK